MNEEQTMQARAALIETMARGYYKGLKSIPQSADGAINAQALKRALLWLDEEQMGIDVIPYLMTKCFEPVTETDFPIAENAAHARMQKRAFELFREGCDILRVLNPFGFS